VIHRFAWRSVFTPETFVNDDRERGRRLRRWPERPSLTKVYGVKKWPPCEPWLNSEAARRDNPIGSHPGAKRGLDGFIATPTELLDRPINELANLHSNDGVRVQPKSARSKARDNNIPLLWQTGPSISFCGR
jgi:hypothetical protein